MTERVVELRIRFVTPSLGNVRGEGGKFFLPRQTGSGGPVVFSPTWHAANIRYAQRVSGDKNPLLITWDPVVGGEPGERPWTQRRINGGRGRSHYAVHESFKIGQCVSFRCRPGADVTNEQLHRLMQLAGQYRGLSPWRGGGGLGRFDVLDLRDVSSFHDESSRTAGDPASAGR